MRTETDALRSLRLYVSLALGEEFNVVFADEDGAFARPSARVIPASETQYASSGRFLADLIQPYGIYVYPLGGEDATLARLAATDAKEALFQAFKVGIDPGHPDRVPLWDFDGVPITEPMAGRFGHDYARVTNFTTQVTRDPTDNRLYTVVANLRLHWRRTTSSIPGGRVVEDIRIGPA